jgi:subtilisin family serine protease
MREIGWLMVAMLVLASPAQGQVRLPGVQLPGDPLQSLQRGIAQADSTAALKLSDARHLAIAALIRSNPRTVGADPRGEAIVRDEILAYAPSEAGLAAARALGFDVRREQIEAELGWRLVVLQKPQNLSSDKALRKLRAADPAGTYEFNHLYTGSGVQGAAAERDDVRPGAPTSTPAARVGLIDTGVDLTHPVFNGTTAHRWGCDDRVIPAAHGTAVASLLVGRAAEFHGVLPSADLYAADVYCGAPTGGAVDALAGAFGWMVRERIAVINVSLVGPDNAVLARIVASLTARGYAIVAAVGNDGPAAPPLYPASYPHVIGVTGVDAHHRVLMEAARGAQVMFAAPGADMAAGAPAGIYVAVRGTSFAAPIVAALLAQRLSRPDATLAAAAVQALAQGAIDLGPPGKDLTYGYGLLGAEFAIDPRSLSGYKPLIEHH